MIYSKILKSLEKRGFEVKILLENDRTILYIIWISEYNIEELESMNSIIKTNRIQIIDVEAFVTGRQPVINNRQSINNTGLISNNTGPNNTGPNINNTGH